MKKLFKTFVTVLTILLTIFFGYGCSTEKSRTDTDSVEAELVKLEMTVADLDRHYMDMVVKDRESENFTGF